MENQTITIVDMLTTIGLVSSAGYSIYKVFHSYQQYQLKLEETTTQRMLSEYDQKIKLEETTTQRMISEYEHKIKLEETTTQRMISEYEQKIKLEEMKNIGKQLDCKLEEIRKQHK